VLADGSGRVKPNVAAPGVNVRSSLRGSDSEYGALSGTSMAGPHTVGVVALLWSAHPYLTRQITETKRILESTANPNVTVPDAVAPYCGLTPPSQIPNNYFGYGRVDALAAVNAGAPKLVGHLTWQGRPAQPDALNQVPVSLTLQLATTTAHYSFLQTDASGFFTVPVGTLPAGTYTWWVKGPQWLATSGSVALTGGATTQQEMGQQRAGDVDNNNLVDTTDFALLRATFGKACGNPGYDARADFTGDCLVDVSDFTLLRSNFGQAGPPRPMGPGAGQP
jgi:subtilisin family serine protease